ncbi:site-specific recombinase XerD [Arthrobacter sp. SLBN-100]|uniref:tyrosine-type recombinase/integrase n=1 Tax=Arthrobacter sp. SLBN-100 TaxID=2768450 RepID=UPI001152D508|nr:tyrosine-type recombinase/integrase [Arthrobacter sp. SLBN-100]TQJ67724.1 site-specific recombinase XerD [Arthrobacter sp. SLBN-100]
MVKVLRSFVRGPLEPHVEGFAEELLRQGYSRSSAEQHVCFIAHLDRWIQAAGVSLGDLSGQVLEVYLVERRAAGYREYRSVKALRPLLDYLTRLGVVPVPPDVPLGPVEELLSRYRVWLLRERGLTAGTVRGYVDCVRPFVVGRLRGEVLELASLTAADVTGFVLTACSRRAVGSAKLIVCALRSLLGWLHVTGQVPVSFAAAVPSVAGWRLSGLPKGLEPAELRRLLAGCDRRTATGRRDFAVLLLLARMGLRADEVASLVLDDIDWRRGELVIVGKGSRAERLPLPDEIGSAIAAYLRRGRPADAQGRSVFVRVHAPHRALTTGGVTMIVFDCAQRSGLPKMHAHRLRHTAATAMLRRGVPLAEVGQVLRHRSAMSTAIYAKVDHAGLSVLARPWPLNQAGGVS